MRFKLLALLFLFIYLTSNKSEAQDTLLIIKDSLDIPEVKFQTKRFKVSAGSDGIEVLKTDIDKKVVNRFLLLDVGYSGYLYKGSLDLPKDLDGLDLRGGRARNIILHLVQQRFGFAKGHMELVWGIMFDFNKYRFVNDILLIPDSIPLTWTESDKDYRKNTLKASYLGIPLMIGIKSNPDKPMQSFRLRAGGFAQVLLNSKQKLLGKVTDRTKVKDDFNLSRFQYGIRAEMGYSILNLYMHYGFNGLFKDDQGPELNPLKFGIILVPY